MEMKWHGTVLITFSQVKKMYGWAKLDVWIDLGHFYEQWQLKQKVPPVTPVKMEQATLQLSVLKIFYRLLNLWQGTGCRLTTLSFTYQNTSARMEDWAGDSTDSEEGKNKNSMNREIANKLNLNWGDYYRSTLGIISFLQQTGAS